MMNADFESYSRKLKVVSGITTFYSNRSWRFGGLYKGIEKGTWRVTAWGTDRFQHLSQKYIV